MLAIPGDFANIAGRFADQFGCRACRPVFRPDVDAGQERRKCVVGSGDDVISSRGAANIIQAGEGDDQVTAGAGDDTVFGGAGDDNHVGRQRRRHNRRWVR